MKERTLFESEEADETGPLFVTNRYNLLDILSSGLITGRAGFSKYYLDFLEYAPQRVPLFGGPVDDTIFDGVIREDPETAFPVVIEINPQVLDGAEVDALTSEGEPIRASLDDSHAYVWAPPAVIPRTGFRAIHFLSAEDREDFLSRPMGNVRSDSTPLEVSPTVGADGPVTGDQVSQWLSSLPTLPVPKESEIKAEDRVGGAILVAHRAAEGSERYENYLLNLVNTNGQKIQNTTDSEIPVWLLQPLYPGDRKRVELPQDGDSVLFRSAVDTMLEVVRDSRWNNAEVIDEIEQRFREAAQDETVQNEILGQFSLLRDVIRARKPFGGFNPGGSDIVKALLLVLSRPDPSSLLSWSREETNATDEVMVAAGLFSGLLNGRKRLEVGQRREDVDDQLAWKAAYRLSRQDEVLGPVEEFPEEQPRSIFEMLAETDPSSETVALQICREMEWEDCILTIIIPPSDEKMEWDMFYAASPRDGRRKIANFCIKGEAGCRYEVDPEAFKSRLEHEGETVPTDLLNALRDDLREQIMA